MKPSHKAPQVLIGTIRYDEVRQGTQVRSPMVRRSGVGVRTLQYLLPMARALESGMIRVNRSSKKNPGLGI